MDPTTQQPSVYDDGRLKTARSEYEGAERKATQAEASAVSLPTMLREALNKKFSADNPLVQNRERALSDYLTTVDQAPLDVTPRSAGGRADVIYTPQEQAALIGAKRAPKTAALSTANLLLGLAEGGISDVVESTSRAGQAEATRLQGEAKIKRQGYADLVDELSRRAEEAFREKQFAEDVRQFNESQKLERELTYARINDSNKKKKNEQALQEVSQIPVILSQLREQQKLARGRVEGLGSKIAGFFGFQPDVTSYEAYRNSVATPIARTLFGEKGNLSDSDIKRAVGLLPKATDTPEEAEKKLNYIEELAIAKINSLESGKDFSAKSLLDKTSKVSKKNDPLGLFE